MKASEIAQRLQGALDSETDPIITGIAGIRDAMPGDLTFVSNPRYASDVAATRASAVLVPQGWDRPAPCAVIRVANPDVAFAQAVPWFAPPPYRPAPGIHPTAIIAVDAVIGQDAHVGPHAVIEAGARLGDRVVIEAGAYVGPMAILGEDTRMYPHSSVRERCVIGRRVILHNGAVIGSDGFGYTVDAQGVRTKIPQVGIVVVGDDVEIGANSTVDRARFGKTIIGRGVKIDNLVQIGHNVVIGDHSVLCGLVGIAGSTSVGARVVLAGQVGVAGHIHIGEGAVIGAQSGVSNSVPAGAFMLGSPAWPAEHSARVFAVMHHLPELKKRVLDLEQRLPKT
ncbi:MAG: UDP-3-O-(3-hydroxymyristoyl)glucosamine N-acyltransferase [Kiritimatiellae bacterium]|nr:UDP-3-O-(3-hydroxymyristoyl)glucosamine N-acyltransferase [Kiritimatiellia bacterium]